MPSDVLTVQALRAGVALQITRCLRRRGLNQLAGAKWLRIPQPTLSKIINGNVKGLSLELLIRVAVRAGLPMVLQTGEVLEEAGAFFSHRREAHSKKESKLANYARDSLHESVISLDPQQRLHAFLEHNQRVGELHRAGRSAQSARLGRSRRSR